MSSWVYLFSKFTPEMLLIESFAICVIVGTYAAFWVLRKRKHGSVQKEVPGIVVRDYLNDMIRDAIQLRNSLFGLLSAAGLAIPSEERAIRAILSAGGLVPGSVDTAGLDPNQLKKMSELEAKMLEQTKAMDVLMLEKGRIEKALADAKAAANAAGGGGGVIENAADRALIDELKKQIALLESKLAEYSVIEDDLANLKRLQQENAQLKASLGGKAEAPAGATAAAAPTPAPEPVAAKPAPAPEPAAAEAAFEGLVDQVEQSLQASTSSNSAAAAPAAPAPAAPAAVAATEGDADLVAEFEKMLNS